MSASITGYGYPPGSDYGHLTQFGFAWGNLEVVRAHREEKRGRVLQVKVDGKERLQVYVSNGGRSVRVWRGDKELR